METTLQILVAIVANVVAGVILNIIFDNDE